MYKYELNGCLTAVFILLLFLFLVKELWWFIIGIIIVIITAYYLNLIYRTISQKQKEKRENYNPQMGEVYKICPYCSTKVKVTEKTCPCCKRALN
ncbi:MAG: hypothetical protein LUH11_01040 [Candidatus Gastranaerophilales bacterium]|nr:hypothetical protein [Candidatus Gastranaerophilales bacterium]